MPFAPYGGEMRTPLAIDPDFSVKVTSVDLPKDIVTFESVEALKKYAETLKAQQLKTVSEQKY